MNDDETSLLEKLSKKSTEKMAKRVGEIDQLRPEELANRKRATGFFVKHHWDSEIGPFLNWLKFAVISISSLAVTALALWYLWKVKDSHAATGELLSDMFNLVLVAGATLYVEHRFIDKDN